jgi:hypothetical protein
MSEKPLMLYTGPTPNGYKVSVFLEELKVAYGGPDYECCSLYPPPFFHSIHTCAV